MNIEKVRKIKSKLALRGVTQAQIAKRKGVSKQFVSQVISGIRRTAYIQDAIAEAVGEPVCELFPDRERAA